MVLRFRTYFEQNWIVKEAMVLCAAVSWYFDDQITVSQSQDVFAVFLSDLVLDGVGEPYAALKDELS